ncbi:unnamed protein product [Urochloa humidicola]
MGSCVSKKAARAGGGRGKVAAPLPAAEKETAHRALPPVAEVDVEEEEVKEVVLSETPAPRPPRLPPPPEPVKPPTAEQPVPEEESASVASEACSASDTASVESAAKETAKAKLLVKAGAEREAEKRAADAPSKKGRAAPPDQERESSKPRVAGGGGNGRARSPSPSSAHRRQHQHPPAPAPAPAAQRPRREQPPVVSGIGCRSGRFSPSAARRAAESAVRRTHSAREADMALPSSSKRSLGAAINGGSGALCRRDAGERSGRRSDSPTGSRRAPASPSAAHRPASPMRKAAAGKEHVHGTPERACKPPTRARDGDEEEPLAGLLGGGERKKVEEGALGQNPSVAMECFIFL